MSTEKKLSKSSKSKKKEAVNKKTAPTSAEFIVDSDVEANSETENAGSSSKSNARKIERSKSSEGLKRKALDDSVSINPKRPKVDFTADRTNKGQTKAPGKSGKDLPLVNGASTHTSQDETTDSGSTSSSETESEAIDTRSSSSPEKASDGVAKNPPTKEQDSIALNKRFRLDSSDESDTGNQDESDEASDEEELTTAVETNDADEEVVVVPPKQSNTTELPSYKPPEGFSLSSIGPDDSEDIRNMFSVENLQGKQIWHITAPAAIPIVEIKGFTRTAMMSGTSILIHRGSNYGFNVKSTQAETAKLLQPGPKDSQFESVPHDIDMELHLRQIVDLSIAPNDAGSVAGGTIAGARKPTLQQPAGLKMRYRPFGDVEDEKTTKQAAEQAKQRIANTQIPLPPISPSPSKKSKTSKTKPQSQEAPTEWVDPQSYAAPVVVGNNSQHAVDLPTAALDESQLANDGEEPPEEKARRKAEKAARREARKQRKAIKATLSSGA